MITAKQLEKAIDKGFEQEYEGRTYTIKGDTFWSEADSYEEDGFDLEGIGHVEVADYSYGGETDNGLFVVLKVGEQYFRKNGVNISHDGWYWDGRIYEATPVTKTIVDWTHA